jgi:hypothetical protein
MVFLTRGVVVDRWWSREAEALAADANLQGVAADDFDAVTMVVVQLSVATSWRCRRLARTA